MMMNNTITIERPDRRTAASTARPRSPIFVDNNDLLDFEQNAINIITDVDSESCSSTSDLDVRTLQNVSRSMDRLPTEYMNKMGERVYPTDRSPQRYPSKGKVGKGGDSRMKRDIVRRSRYLDSMESMGYGRKSAMPEYENPYDLKRNPLKDFARTFPSTPALTGRSHSMQKPNSTTPGLLLFPNPLNGHYQPYNGRRSKEKSKRQRLSANGRKSRSPNIFQNMDERSPALGEWEYCNGNQMKVYFRFSKGTMGETLPMDYYQNEEYARALTAHCRGYLARQNFEKRLKENEAVRIIQRNCERVFNPWIRLLWSLRPMLKSNRIEEELMYLRSELERYKTLVKMLRFENAEYQAKVANLLHLIEQINTKGVSSAVVNDLVKQISDNLTKNQEFWQEMASANEALQSAILPRPRINGLTAATPVTPNSPMTRLRNDADFYRNQVELLKEEADEQQYRSSEHFQGQVSVLTNRLEHLQHLLTMETNKVERLSAELEEMNNTVAASRNYERNLEQMVNQLSKQLEQKNKAAAANETVQSPVTPVPGPQNGDKFVTVEAVEKELNAYRNIISELRAHLSTHPQAMAILSNTPFQPGGELDLHQDPFELTNTYNNLEPATRQQLFAKPVQNDSVRADALKTDEIAALKRQLLSATNNLKEYEERVRNEVEDRELVETENRQLQNRVSALDRELRCSRDEFEEALRRRDLLHQNELKELTDQLEEEIRKSTRLTQQNKELDLQLVELRNANEDDENILNDEWESTKSKLKAEIAYYKRSFDVLQEEFDQYRQDHDMKEVQRQLAERNERITVLEQEQHQWRIELDVQQVKLQNATNLLEDAEKRLKLIMREKSAQIHRITQLENERDAAIREAATISGRASAEKEHTSAKLREYEDLKVERDALRRELSEVKETLAGCTAEIAAERRQAQARLKDLSAHQEVRVADLKAELERSREEVERLQAELQAVQASEADNKSAKQQGRWRINELEDQLSHSLLRISALERHNADLDAELVRAKADLSASREAANMLRASRTRVADEWMQGGGDDTEDEELNRSVSLNANRTDYGLDTLSEDSTGTVTLRRPRLSGSGLRSGALYRSNPALYRTLGASGRSQSAIDRNSFRRSAANILDSSDKIIHSNGTDHTEITPTRHTTIVRELESPRKAEAT